jgi:hypothetical protein
MYNTKDLNNELAKHGITAKELELIIGICKFIIDTLETCIFAKYLEEEKEEE